MKNLRCLDHPLADHLLTLLREQSTPQSTYRSVCDRISQILAIEAGRLLETRTLTVETPLETCEGRQISTPVVVVPILRAGLGMLPSFLHLYPEASVGYIGLERDEITAQPSEYYCKLPRLEGSLTLLVDPMLATGGSACKALQVLRSKDPHLRCLLISIIAAPEGVQRVHEAFPDIPILTAVLDRELDANQYIRPGLGDFGDRLFGT